MSGGRYSLNGDGEINQTDPLDAILEGIYYAHENERDRWARGLQALPMSLSEAKAALNTEIAKAKAGSVTPQTPNPQPFDNASGGAYDSTVDTLKHIKRVNQLLGDAAVELTRRGQVHDDSKLVDPEKAIFDEFTPKLKDSTYGSDEYKSFLVGMGEALQHHYQNNSHHPEHYENGIEGMDLFDLLEMLIDWKAAGERHSDGSLLRSIELNKSRFEVGDQLHQILLNTAERHYRMKEDSNG